jgi:hypothetical protein
MRKSKQDSYYWCNHGEHWQPQVLVDTQANGRLICPIHKKPLRLSSNAKEYKRKITI